jgi:hypothetical protein
MSPKEAPDTSVPKKKKQSRNATYRTLHNILLVQLLAPPPPPNRLQTQPVIPPRELSLRLPRRVPDSPPISGEVELWLDLDMEDRALRMLREVNGDERRRCL